jgi:putative ABC transport system permease protein
MNVIAESVQAGRVFRHAPLFSSVVVAVLGAGLAFVLTIAALVDTVFLKPLPYRGPDRVVMLWGRRVGNPFMREMNVSGPVFNEWVAGARSFDGVSAFTFPRSMHMAGGAYAERLNVASVTANALAVLGVDPVRGRGFGPADEGTGDRPVIISHAVWQRQFGAGDVVGRRIRLDTEPSVIVGVLPTPFYLANLVVLETDALTLLRRSDSLFAERERRPLMVFARLKPTASIETAQADLDAITAAEAAAHPGTDRGWTAFVQQAGHDAVAYWRATIGFVAGGVGCIALIVAATLLLLVLCRVVDRDHEVALRLALGGSRADVFRHWTIEGAVLSCAALGAGMLGAEWLLALFRYVDIAYFPRIGELALTPRSVTTAAAVAATFALSSGMVAFVRANGAHLDERLHRATAGGPQSRTQMALVMLQIALTIATCAASGVLAHDLTRLVQLDMGFDREGLFSARIALPPAASAGHARDLYARLQTSLARELGPVPIAIDSNLPAASSATIFFSTRGESGGDQPWADAHVVSADYFSTLRIPILAGAVFSDRTPESRIVIVNRTLAERFFGGGDAVGREIVIAGAPDADPGASHISPGAMRIVAIVGDTIDWPLAKNKPNQIYVPLFDTPPGSVYVVARRPGADALTAVRRAAVSVDPDMAVFDAATMNDRLLHVVAMQRLNTAIAFGTGGFGLVLASLGIYGVVAYRVRRRWRELGVRIALGASPRTIKRLVLRDSVIVMVAGVAAGCALAAVLRPALNAVLFRSVTADAPSIAVSAVLVTLVGVGAACIPAFRAARLNPLEALRDD